MKIYNKGILVATTVRNKEKTEAWVQLLPNVPEELVPWDLFGVGIFRRSKVDLIFAIRKWLPTRVFPKERIGVEDELRELGLEDYDIIEIVKKTEGKHFNDEVTVELEGVERNSFSKDNRKRIIA